MKHLNQLVLLLVITFFSVNAYSQSFTIQGIVYSPIPATSCTNTSATVSTYLGCINAVHTGNNFTIVGNTITIEVAYTLGPICFGAISYPTHIVNLGMIPAGTYTVVVEGVLNTVIVSTITSSLTVNNCCSATADFSISRDTVCINDSVFFSNASTGAVSQAWYENNVQVSTNNDYSTSFATPGLYNIKLKANAAGCSDSLTKQVWVTGYPLVDLGKDTTICKGGSYLLFAGSGADSIKWSNNSTGSLITASAPGQYWVEVYKNGCSSKDTMVLSNYPEVDPSLGNDTILCHGDTLVLNASNSAAVGYEWQDASTAATFTVSQAGVYTVKLTDNKGCVSIDTITITYDSCGTGINETNLEKLVSVFPNPARNLVNIELMNGGIIDIIELYDISGKMVHSIKANDASKTIDVSALKKGVYLLSIKAQGETTSRYFVKE